MTEQELINLEIEKRALIATANEMSKEDACIEISLRLMVDNLRDKANNIQIIINNHLYKE